MLIFIKNIQNMKMYTLDINEDSTINDLKKKFSNSYGIFSINMKFIFNNEILKNDKTIKYYRITFMSTIIYEI